MMRSMVRVALAVAVLVVAARPASAQMGISFGAMAGLAVPVGDTESAVNSGFTVGGLLRVKPLLSPVALRFEGGFNSFEYKNEAFQDNLNIWNLTGNVELNLAPTGMIYGIGGAGFFGSSSGGQSETDFGFNAGAGVRIPLTGLGAFVEAKYTRIMHEGGNTSYVPIVFGITF